MSAPCLACTDTEYCTPCWDALPYVAGRKFDAKQYERRLIVATAAGRLANLASCLRAAAGLELAWKLSAFMATTTCNVVLMDTPRAVKVCGNLLPCRDHDRGWRPGCGRALAGWEVGT